MSAPAVVIATDLSEFRQGDEVDARINGAWCPFVVLGPANFLGHDSVEVRTRHPLATERHWLPGKTQARWARVAA